MQPVVGSKLKEKHATKWLGAMARLLYPGETVVAVATTAGVRPVLDGIAVTNARVVAFVGNDLSAGGGFRVEVAGDDIAHVEMVKPRITKAAVVVTGRDGRTTWLGIVPDPDQAMILGAVRQLAEAGPAPDAGAAMAHQAELAGQSRDRWERVETLGSPPNRGSWKAIKDHCSPAEVPWFVIGSLAAGAFAAFEDRCMIVKAGLVPSIGAGSLGGGRITTFPYAEITAIEYNAGLMSGVLEVLTPSYQGSSNKDYWRGFGKNPNANSDSPFTLSNTLPLNRPEYQRALPRLNELRAKVTASKRPTVVAAGVPASPDGGFAEELTELARLRDQGVLTAAEFDAAKQRTLTKHGLA